MSQSEGKPEGATRIGVALQRAPYAWLTVSVLLLFFSLGPFSAVVDVTEPGSVGLAIAASGWIAVNVAVAGWYNPRFVYPKVTGEFAGSSIALMRWAYGIAPFLVGLAAVLVGAQQWSLSVGFVASVVLLFLAARSLAKDRTKEVS
ncbi:MAG: hypothetical protein GY926_12170 [bacterium]|nr:hypothetical protein [bacterium]